MQGPGCAVLTNQCPGRSDPASLTLLAGSSGAASVECAVKCSRGPANHLHCSCVTCMLLCHARTACSAAFPSCTPIAGHRCLWRASALPHRTPLTRPINPRRRSAASAAQQPAAMASAAPPPAGPPSEYEPFLEVALAAAKEAGAAIAAAWNAPKTIDTKSGGQLEGALHEENQSPRRAPRLGGGWRRAAHLQRPSRPCRAGDADLVTETDKKCEALVLDRIRQAFPDHKFIGEEGSAAQVGCCAQGWLRLGCLRCAAQPVRRPWRL